VNLLSVFEERALFLEVSIVVEEFEKLKTDRQISYEISKFESAV
jgi:hypothetical protein